MNYLENVILGTAQLTRLYGAERYLEESTEIVKSTEILHSASKAGIRHVDTAPSYGDAESALSSEFCRRNFDIQTKWISQAGPVLPQLESSLRALNRRSLSAYLMHDSLISAGNKILEDLKILADSKVSGIVGRLGFSVYTKEEVDLILELGVQNGIVQLPFNPLMKDLLLSEQIQELIRKGFEIQVRSIFMQGMLTSKKQIRLSKTLPSIEKARLIVQKMSSELGISPNALLVSYALAMENVSRVVVGVSHPDEVALIHQRGGEISDEVMKMFSGALDELELSTFESNPANWSNG